MSHAMMIAHSNDLTHGAFNLSNILVRQDEYQICFKVNSFKPWLVREPTEYFTAEEML